MSSRQVVEAILQAHAEVEAIHLSPEAGSPGDTLAIVLLRSDEPGVDLTERIAELFAEQGLTVLPILYTASERRRLGTRFSAEAWTQWAGSGAGLADLLTVYRQRRPFPGATRSMLLAFIRSARESLAVLRSDPRLLPHLALEASASLAGQALDLCCATRGVVLPLDASASPGVLEALSDFSPRCLTIHLRLRALAAKARHLFLALGEPAIPAPGPEIPWGELEAFLGQWEAQVQRDYTMVAEVRRRRLWVLLSAGAVALTTLIVFLVMRLPRTPDLLPQGASTGGITGEYFRGADFGESLLVRTDRSLEHSWRGAFAPGQPPDHFAVRWSGYLRFPVAGTSSLCLAADDGARLFFQDDLLLDAWSGKLNTTRCREVRTRSGWYRIRLEFREWTGPAKVWLKRGPDPTTLRKVPATDLCCQHDARRP